MVTTLVLPRLLARSSVPRIVAVSSRNLIAFRHSAMWLVVISGFFEPVLYLMSIGIGVGGLVGSFTLANGTVVSYAAFVAPAMLAASAMNGAMAESTFNFFGRLKWAHLYDAMVATPLRPLEIAIGELVWALVRGTAYAATFLALMVAMHLTTAGWAVAALLASILVGATFGCAGMAITTTMRTWQDFDYLLIVQFGLFLFSGTFAPVETYPPVMRVIVELTPLYQSVALMRDLTTGHPTWASLGHVAYLAVLAAVGVTVAARRMTTILCK